MTQQTSGSGWPVLRGIQTVKEVSYLNMRQAAAAAALDKLWSDTFLTNAGIDSGASSGYTYQGSTNFNVILNAGGDALAQRTGANAFTMYYGGGNFSRGIGQVFTAPASVSIGGFTLKMAKAGTPTGTIVGKLYAVSAGVPTGAALATTAAFDVSTLGAAAEVVFNFTAAVNITASSIYAITLEYGTYVGDVSNYLSITYLNGSAVTGGYLMNTGAWSGGNTEDLYFVINIPAATTASVISVRALDLAANITQVMLFADVTLGTGTALYYVSSDDGSTWVAATPEALTVVAAGKQIRAKVEMTGNASLNSWGVAV